MSENKIYKKVNGRYKEIGVEFRGFPMDGIWFVKDGHNNCMVRLSEIGDAPVNILPYRQLVQEYLETNYKGNMSISDRLIDLADFFATKANEQALMREL